MKKSFLIILRGERESRSKSHRSARVVELVAQKAKPLRYRNLPPGQTFDYCLLTSAKTWRFLKHKPKAKTFVCIGPATRLSLPARLRKNCLSPKTFDRGGVLGLFANLPRGRIYFPRSALADLALPSGLKKLGFRLVVQKVYTMRPVLRKTAWQKAVSLAAHESGPVYLGVTSPSVFRALLKIESLARLKRRSLKFVPMGPTTATYLRRQGLKTEPSRLLTKHL